MAILGLDNTFKVALFVGYLLVGASYGLLNDNARYHKISFNKSSAVLIQNFLKFIIALIMYLKADGNFNTLLVQIPQTKGTLALYLVPAGLYAAYDIIGYSNLAKVDSPTYFIVLQIRILATAFMHQWMFSKVLNKNQWIALCFVMVGVITQIYGKMQSGINTSVEWYIYGSIFFQVFLTVGASIFNEKLLKGQNTPLNLQNMYMYSCSILLVALSMVLGVRGDESLTEALRYENVAQLFSPYVFPIILVMSMVGIITSLFLKHLDSIRKTVANALEIVLLAVVSCLLFDAEFTIYLVVAVLLVSSGIVLYSRPVQAAAVTEQTTEDEKETVQLTRQGRKGLDPTEADENA